MLQRVLTAASASFLLTAVPPATRPPAADLAAATGKQTIVLASGQAVVRSAVSSYPVVHKPRSQFHASVLDLEIADLRVQEAKLADDVADYQLGRAQAAVATVSKQFAKVSAADRAGTGTQGCSGALRPVTGRQLLG